MATKKKILKDFLTPKEAELFLSTAKSHGKHATRNYTLLLLMYRHGLRVSEAIDLRISDIDFKSQRIYIRRLKNGLSTHQPLQADTMKALKEHLKTSPPETDFVFSSQRGPMTRFCITQLCLMLSKICKLPPVNPHMLRHSCGYTLANKGFDIRLIQDYLGHKCIQTTVRYTQVCESRFQQLWRK